ncbi:protein VERNALIZATION 3-like [Humulus lupulus]|uniref:protein VERNALIZATION 3-like n=1 Tax=Humulus lupulus TaxID=3486 RepID=UPI002B416106|nr:protein VERNALIZATION 3-like [Humulus lupulus]
MARDLLVVDRVIKDVLDPFTKFVSLKVLYSGNRAINYGIDLRPSQVANQPRVEIDRDDLRTFYTLVIMVDPNLSDLNLREYSNWLVTNIPATTGAGFGQVMCYESPQPTVGIHRYVFVLFWQLGRQTVYTPGWRHNFNTRDFAKIYNLGLPIVAVYFNCQKEINYGGRRS